MRVAGRRLRTADWYGRGGAVQLAGTHGGLPGRGIWRRQRSLTCRDNWRWMVCRWRILSGPLARRSTSTACGGSWLSLSACGRPLPRFIRSFTTASRPTPAARCSGRWWRPAAAAIPSARARFSWRGGPVARRSVSSSPVWAKPAPRSATRWRRALAGSMWRTRPSFAAWMLWRRRWAAARVRPCASTRRCRRRLTATSPPAMPEPNSASRWWRRG